jgi:chromosome segregation ATPase
MNILMHDRFGTMCTAWFLLAGTLISAETDLHINPVKASTDSVGIPLPSATGPANTPTDQTAIDLHLRDLAKKIEQLEQRLGQSQGRGAFRRGTSFVVEGGGQESVLERLRRVERELQQAQLTLAGREAALAEAREQSERDRQRVQGLSEKADSLAQVKDHLITAQQTLAERQAIIDQLNQRLTETELARLRVERTYFLLAATVLRLMPGQGQDLIDLQEQVRQQAKVLQPINATMTPSSAKESP